jgi:hypothetical protein
LELTDFFTRALKANAYVYYIKNKKLYAANVNTFFEFPNIKMLKCVIGGKIFIFGSFWVKPKRTQKFK